MAGYIGSKASVVSSGAERKKVFAITTTTTSLTGLSYTVDQVHVYHNGIRLVDGTDYTATNGTSITLTNGAESGDEVVVVSYATFQTSDTVSASAGGTFAAPVTIDGNSATVLTVDRATTDGTVIDVQRGGTSVGSIGTYNGVPYIGYQGGTGGGIMFNATSIEPTGLGSARTNGINNIGSPLYRFKDLYLSGGVYLGGTGAANKLDDYEEGTWTPTFEEGTWSYSKQYGSYTKVGNLVTVWYSIVWGARSGSAALILTSLPFTPFAGDGNARAGGSLGTHTGLDTSGGKQIVASIDGNINAIFYRFMNDNADWSSVNLQDCEPVGEVQGTFTYRT